MGLFDTIMLLDPLPCYSCHSTKDDEVGSNQSEEKMDFDGQELSFISLHDGRGGMKDFQTKGMEDPHLAYFWFPGYIFPKMECEQNPMDIIEICNMCDIAWKGKLYLREVEDIEVLLTDYIEVWPDQIPDEDNSLVINTEEFSCLSVHTYADGKLMIEPNIDASIREYHKRSRDLRLKAEMERDFIASIRNSRVPKKIILSALDDLIEGENTEKVESSTPLVRAVSDYCVSMAKEVYSREALEAALTVLYHNDKEYAFDVLAQSGVLSQEEFLKELWYHEWFFVPKHKLNDDHRLWRFAGADCGANYFLGKVRFMKYPDNDFDYGMGESVD